MRRRRLAVAVGSVGILGIAGWLGLAQLDRAYPPDLSRLQELSRQVVDREGRPLRTYLTEDGLFRLPTTVDEVDPRYLRMLVAYEDKRFQHHASVDPLAVIRAGWQALVHGRIVSGASTLTMQTARLLEPHQRTFAGKLFEMARALQLERRFSKREILSMYLTLAPFGGNLEGVRAGARVYFRRPPASLTAGEAALLVALPRAPSRYRPDRHAEAARAARDAVLARAGPASGYQPHEIALARSEAVGPETARATFLAPHLADRVLGRRPTEGVVRSTVDAVLQRRLEGLAKGWAGDLGTFENVAILVVANKTREVLAYVGSADFTDEARDGQVDLVRAVRSPGSTLKPILYGLAFERGLAHPATIVNDVPTQFGDYAPANFMRRHYGEVSLTEALQQSLNVPAVAVLERLGPVSVVERLGREGVCLAFGQGDAVPGLALALGGVGTTLEDLVRLYAAIADDGRPRNLRYLQGDREWETADGSPLLGRAARWYVAEILRRMPPPGRLMADRHRRSPRRIGFKTGTSYGFRDAWALGFDGAHTVGVWVGRPDGVPSPGRYGANTAAPLLFRIFEQLPSDGAEPPPAPVEALALETTALPPGLRYLGRGGAPPSVGRAGPPPRIVYPLDASLLALPAAGRGIGLGAEGGQRPLTWLVDGVPLVAAKWSRGAEWRPDGPGFSEIVLIDALGRRARARVRLIEAE